jgi:hypothetical protein
MSHIFRYCGCIVYVLANFLLTKCWNSMPSDRLLTYAVHHPARIVKHGRKLKETIFSTCFEGHVFLIFSAANAPLISLHEFKTWQVGIIHIIVNEVQLSWNFYHLVSVPRLIISAYFAKIITIVIDTDGLYNTTTLNHENLIWTYAYTCSRASNRQTITNE